MIRGRKTTWLLARAVEVLFLVGACSVPAAAQTLSNQWQYGVFIYGYFPRISGSATFPTGQSVDITVDPNQIIHNLKFTVMGSFAAQKGPWGVFVDLLYLDVSGSKSATRALSIGNLPIPAGVTANANPDVRSTIWTFGPSYRLVATPEVTFDVLAGARELYLRQDLGFQFSADVGPFVGPGRQGSVGIKTTNWDGLIGAKGRFAFGNRHEWFLPYYFDVGTGQSHLTWQAIGGLGYAFTWGEVVGLWRYLDYRFSKDDTSFKLNGPAIGVAFHWM